jgi:hypothetical protein
MSDWEFDGVGQAVPVTVIVSVAVSDSDATMEGIDEAVTLPEPVLVTVCVCVIVIDGVSAIAVWVALPVADPVAEPVVVSVAVRSWPAAAASTSTSTAAQIEKRERNVNEQSATKFEVCQRKACWALITQAYVTMRTLCGSCGPGSSTHLQSWSRVKRCLGKSL